MRREAIDRIAVVLKVDGTTSLFVLLTADGTVNRMGDGDVGCSDQTMFVGLASEPLFERLRDQVSEAFLEEAGAYEIRDRVGQDCTLEILFGVGDQVSGLVFRYGSRSQGPPKEVCDFVELATSLTDAWRDEVRQSEPEEAEIRRPPDSPSSKPWWRFW